MRIKKTFLFVLLNVFLINSCLIIQPAHSSIQELPFSDSPTLLFNDSYEKSISFTPSSSPLEQRIGIAIFLILYNGSIYFRLTENTTNSTISSLFLDFSLPITWKKYSFVNNFGIYTINFLNNESLNATFSFAVSFDALWIDIVLFPGLFFIILPPLTIGLILYFSLTRKRNKQ